jgi:hypothetical protein
MQYLNQIKNRRRSSQMISSPKPVLTPEDEAYFREVTAHPESIPLPADNADEILAEIPAGGSQQPTTSASEQAENIPLPTSPAEEFGKELGEESRQERKGSEPTLSRSETPKSETSKAPQKKKRWSAMFWKKNTDKVRQDFNVDTYQVHMLVSICTNLWTRLNRVKMPVPRTNLKSKPRLQMHQMWPPTEKTQTKIKTPKT